VGRGMLKKLIEELANAATFDDVGDLRGLIEAGEKAWRTSRASDDYFGPQFANGVGAFNLITRRMIMHA
jgi:hypothetical protein